MISNPGVVDRLARRILLSKLSGVKGGTLTVMSDRADSVGDPDPDDPVEVSITVNDPSFFRKVLFGGGTGAGESYMSGDWETDDLVALIAIIARNESVYDGLDGGLALLSEWKNHLLHSFSKNTRRGSKQNIVAHYDLGNDFFSLFLDETMAYSSGIYAHDDATLKDASVEKFDRVCRKLEIGARDRIVEIGTGWGGFALHAAENYGCEVVTTTVSEEQHSHASELVAEKKLDDKIKVLKRDYRDMEGTFDKLVSIEMIEAVGYNFLDTFMDKCGSLLTPDGQMALQAITVPDRRYDKHKSQSSWINKYIFPGSNLLSRKAICDSAMRTSAMSLVDEKDIADDYARTLREWRGNFWRNIDRVRELGLPERFVRMWNFYLCCCEAAFRERWIGDSQYIFARREPA
jgi:cyclopropane-fatty-acyl-phospholipid synthase